MASQFPSQARSLYRCILRELPQRPLSSPSPLAARIRIHLASQPSPENNSTRRRQMAQAQMDEAEQIMQYLRAQRQYVTLLERYNPGANMDEEERVRLTARRVGMELPIEAEGIEKSE
ncbi:putative Ras guanyl-nucleotide exchange factor RasGEF [Histoplasma ohiense]|nr:putative Ras guanyl-nucleotide exchange factor RasGEF [Histoplasma ohiense (nom. inval.)]